MSLSIKVTGQKFVTALYWADSLGMLFRSLDGGVRWVSLPAPVAGTVLRMSWLSPLVGLAACDTSGVYRTGDGGLTWVQVLAGTYKAVAFLPDGRAWAVGASATMKRSLDGGLTWTTVTLPGIGTTTLLGVAVTAASSGGAASGVCVGEVYSGSAVIMYGTLTALGVETWTLAASGRPATALYNCDLWRSASDCGKYRVAVGTVTVYSNDFGVNWGTAVDLGIGNPATECAVTTPSHRIVGRYYGSSPPPTLQHSVDSGVNFTTYAVLGYPYFGDVAGITYLVNNPSFVWVGGNFYLWQSRNGGASWNMSGGSSPCPSLSTFGTMAAVTGYLQIGPSMNLAVV